MNLRKLLCSFTLLTLLLATLPAMAIAEERSIYVGDIITLEITSRNFSEAALREKFQDFEIVEIKAEPDGYLLSLRTFNVGEYTVLLGSNEIVISVSSTLDDIQREDIFEGEADIIEEVGFSFHWRLILYVALSVFVLSGGFVLTKRLLKRYKKKESAYRLFLRRAASLSESSDGYFVDLTFYFKRYLESLYERPIIGKTSAEIIRKLEEISFPAAMLPDVRKWLTECDTMKFSGVETSSDEKHRHYERLLGIAQTIEANQGHKDEETK